MRSLARPLVTLISLSRSIKEDLVKTSLGDLSRARIYLSLLLCVLGVMTSPSKVRAEDDVDSLKARIKVLEAKLAQRPHDPSHYTLPKQITFCGDTIDLTPSNIRRRFESELIKIIKRRAQVQLYINRATSVFPVIDEIAKELNTCSDLKYVAVVESALKPRAISRAKATGWWQFMPATASGFKLQVNAYLDERSDLRASTRAALTYLRRLYKRFGSWPLAMAGYNTGPGRLKRSSKAQNQSSFWSLDLYTEAERYSPRVLAMYYVLSHLKKYDFGRTLKDGWAQEPLEAYRLMLETTRYKRRVTVDETKKRKTKKTKKRRTKRKAKQRKTKQRKTKKRKIKKSKTQVNPKLFFTSLSVALKVPLRDLKRYNPHLIGDRLPIGVAFDLYLPPGHSKYLARALDYPTQPKRIYQNQSARGLGQVVARKSSVTPPPSPEEIRLRSHREALKALGGSLIGDYVVRRGDQLWQIAARAEISVAQLRKLNGLSPLSVLQIGQRLRLDVE